MAAPHRRDRKYREIGWPATAPAGAGSRLPGPPSALAFLLVLLLAPFRAPAAAREPGEIRHFGHTRYEYDDMGPGSPLVILIPGFTQHNRSLEFRLLIGHFLERGFSVLMPNPPQHGEDYAWNPVYAWGEREDADLRALADSLVPAGRHGAIHVVGFSIGAKIALRFAAAPGKSGDSLASVAAVAPPYRVADIDCRLSGDPLKPDEAFISAGGAQDRAGLGRILYMGLAGMPRALMDNRATPADEVPAIRAPVLLVHGSDDWLIRSHHAKRLFARARPDQPISLVILRTRAHAEDMLSRDGSATRDGLLALLDAWMGSAPAIRAGAGAPDKVAFDSAFQARLDTLPWVSGHRVPPSRVPALEKPPRFRTGDRLWRTDPDGWPARLIAGYSRGPARLGDHYFLGFAPWLDPALPFPSGSLAISDSTPGRRTRYQAGLGLNLPRGAWIWPRRLGFSADLADPGRRALATADLAVFLLDLRLDWGTFAPGKRDLDISLDWPFLSTGGGGFFLGLGYNAFWRGVPGYDRDHAEAYASLALPGSRAAARPRLNLHYGQGLFFPGARALGADVTVAFGER